VSDETPATAGRLRAACMPAARAEDHVAMTLDPAASNPEHYRVVFENDRVRVLEYRDEPGDRTTPHEHPDSVMYTLSAFRRRLSTGADQKDVEIPAGMTGWVPAQQHHGENIGDTPTHCIFVELKEPTQSVPRTTPSSLGPEGT
jgi:quercetin dioxygenase-like cupin family protein